MGKAQKVANLRGDLTPGKPCAIVPVMRIGKRLAMKRDGRAPDASAGGGRAYAGGRTGTKREE
jgi:hypothetical protein